MLTSGFLFKFSFVKIEIVAKLKHQENDIRCLLFNYCKKKNSRQEVFLTTQYNVSLRVNQSTYSCIRHWGVSERSGPQGGIYIINCCHTRGSFLSRLDPPPFSSFDNCGGGFRRMEQNGCLCFYRTFEILFWVLPFLNNWFRLSLTF